MAFKKGKSGNPKGRQPGTPNKVTTEVKTMILQALAGAGGVDYLIERARDTPGPFLALVGKVLPLQVTDGEGKRLFPEGGIMFVIQQQPGSENQT